MRVRTRRAIWVVIGGGLFVGACAWAIYVSSFYLFLARAFPTEAPESAGPSAALASMQGYAVALGPLGVLIVGTSIWLLLHRRAGHAGSRDQVD